jgi:hypothetical protein
MVGELDYSNVYDSQKFRNRSYEEDMMFQPSPRLRDRTTCGHLLCNTPPMPPKGFSALTGYVIERSRA